MGRVGRVVKSDREDKEDKEGGGKSGGQKGEQSTSTAFPTFSGTSWGEERHQWKRGKRMHQYYNNLRLRI